MVVAIQGKEIRDQDDLLGALERHRVGEQVTVTVLRNDARKDLKIVLDAPN